ncbi:HtrA protease/chaperone protein [hydrothermal vent metagenome]|uniref:Probable periplasmic serine endoprotease DegP-like n=1 Tax=hydrothermal vent metagenome TaxID=652676 RepID=A0A3B1AL96_9ZZZZ
MTQSVTQAVLKTRFTYILLAAFLLAVFPGQFANAAGPKSVADLAERLQPAVVNISTKQKVTQERSVPIPNLPEDSPFRDFFDDFFDKQKPKGKDGEKPRNRRGRSVSSLGSGFVIDASGIIITNNHVIDKADEIEVIFTDGRKLKAKVIGRDKKTDLAVLKVEPKKPLVAVSFGDSKKLRVGDWVMAIGNPFGLGGSVSLGIVSARNRDINSGPYDDFIQTDAAINKGNSGGPLFNMDGEVVGINTAIISPSGGSIGIGFSIPSSTAERVINQLREFGETRRGWLGVRIQSITDDLAESLGLKNSKGALVADLTETGPAEKAGMKPGDVIIQFDGQAVNKLSDLPRIVARAPVGKQVDVVVIRKGKEVTIGVTLGRLEDGEKIVAQKAGGKKNGAVESVSVLGMKLTSLTDELRKKFKVAEKAKGVVVTSVDSNSVAADKRIQPGDIIAEAGEKEISTPADLEKRVKELKKEGRGSILLLILKTARGGDPNFIALRLE